jgi:hypothetical protein
MTYQDGVLVVINRNEVTISTILSRMQKSYLRVLVLWKEDSQSENAINDRREGKSMKKCEPFKCARFKRLYERTWMRVPADRWVMICPFRAKSECGYREGQNLMGGI